MDGIQILVTLGGIALIAATLWFFFGKSAGPGTGKKKYSCPMHPWITSDDPATPCSLCGMPLVQSDGPKQ
ncbi:hypothetical protein GMST_18710 [Geomonas silvestris]|uniref:Heavy metal binding domain-containing protein n=1 Tax=Geomonas silvestris TaxID=2740184 RepID=A0A6V8MHT1_9BACT|nr:heavy metal-binding domain-containing protein [Geomonas silvestris]GFO59546.1 hypothetical protein GMST_18710 [Geomonas silvestris]